MKDLTWLADSRSRLKSFPAGVQDDIGYALYAAQCIAPGFIITDLNRKMWQEERMSWAKRVSKLRRCTGLADR